MAGDSTPNRRSHQLDHWLRQGLTVVSRRGAAAGGARRPGLVLYGEFSDDSRGCTNPLKSSKPVNTQSAAAITKSDLLTIC